MIAQGLQPYLKSRQDIDFQFLGLPTVLHATTETTGGRFGLMEHATIPPGFASPYHTHHDEDEAFYVLEGQMRFVCDGKWMSAGAGTWIYGPREIPHGFKVVGSRPARMLLMCAPAGFEKFALQLSAPAGAPPAPPDIAKLMAAAEQYNVDILGPLPETRTRPTGPGTPSSRPSIGAALSTWPPSTRETLMQRRTCSRLMPSSCRLALPRSKAPQPSAPGSRRFLEASGSRTSACNRRAPSRAVT